MREKDKMLNGEPFNVNMDDGLLRERRECRDLCHEYNKISPANGAERKKRIVGILGKTGRDINVEPPFYCDYGWNTEVGNNFNSECNLVIQDAGGVFFGENIFIGPNCGFYTKARPFDSERRNEGVEFARRIVNVREAKGMCIRDLAAILSRSEGAAYKWMKLPSEEWRLSDLLLVCRKLSIPIDDVRTAIKY